MKRIKQTGIGITENRKLESQKKKRKRKSRRIENGIRIR